MQNQRERRTSLWLRVGCALLIAVSCKQAEMSPPGNDPALGSPETAAAPETAEATTKSKSAAQTEAVDGDGQEATVGTAVAVSPAMRVRDAQGDPVAGVQVGFRSFSGDGQVQGDKQTTGVDGVARSGAWTLGPRPGRQELVAEVPGLAPIYFVATALPDARGSFLAVTTVSQIGRAGESAQPQPEVEVLAQNGTPRSGVAVRFVVVSGGGTLSVTEALTDASGRARVIWTFGSSPGENRVRAEIDDLPAVEFVAQVYAPGAPSGIDQNVLASGLANPWGLAFTPTGALYFTERVGRVSLLRPAASGAGFEARVIVLSPPGDLRVSGQSGMLGIAVDPEFQTNGYVYVFMARSISSSSAINVIRRYTAASDGTLSTPFEVFPKPAEPGIAWGADGAHSGGRIKFGPDGFLWITTGDNRSARVPQDLNSLGGKVLRITKDGDPAPGNPVIATGARPEIYFYGVRNVNGLAFDDRGRPFICEHGPGSPRDDEVTQINAGGNGGWNPNTHPTDSNHYTGYPSDHAGVDHPGDETTVTTLPNVRPPLYGRDSAGMAGCDFAYGSTWRDWNGLMVIGILGDQRLVGLRPNADATSVVAGSVIDNDSFRIFPVTNVFARIREVLRGPNGDLFIATDNYGSGGDRIVRVSPRP